MNRIITQFLFILLIIIFSSCATRPKWEKMKNGERNASYFILDNRVFLGADLENKVLLGDKGAPPLKEADYSTFEVLTGTEYARDKNNVYFPIEIMCVDGIGWGYCYARCIHY